MPTKCFQCESDSPSTQKFCGNCGSPLALGDYLAARVALEVSSAVKDRDVLEKDSTIRVVERVWDVLKIAGAFLAVVIGIVGAVGFYKFHDLTTAIEQGKTSVNSDVVSAEANIQSKSGEALAGIQLARAGASESAKKLSYDLEKTASVTRSSIETDSRTIKKAAQVTRSELSSAKQLQPQIQELRSQLDTTTSELEKQRKLLSSSEDLAKEILSSRIVNAKAFTDPKGISAPVVSATLASVNYAVVPPPGGKGNTLVYILLPSTPISNTLDLQYRISMQPRDSYFTIHNLLIFFWGDSVESLKQYPLIATYFPDRADKQLIKALSVVDGKVLADDKPAWPQFSDTPPGVKK